MVKDRYVAEMPGVRLKVGFVDAATLRRGHSRWALPDRNGLRRVSRVR